LAGKPLKEAQETHQYLSDCFGLQATATFIERATKGCCPCHTQEGVANRPAAGAHLDLAEQVGDVLVVKGQATAQERIQDDPAAPHVHLGARVQLPRDHLGAAFEVISVLGSTA
jgi:hypothetical protein